MKTHATHLVAKSLTIVDEDGEPRIALNVAKHYAGISFFKKKGKKRYEALHIYVSEFHHGSVEMWQGPFSTALTLNAHPHGAGLVIHDAAGKVLHGFGTRHADNESVAKGKKRPPRRSRKNLPPR